MAGKASQVRWNLIWAVVSFIGAGVCIDSAYGLLVLPHGGAKGFLLVYFTGVVIAGFAADKLARFIMSVAGREED